jgi:uncharacterized protein YuzE
MKLHYYKETDSLYIDLSEAKSVDSREVAPGVVADFDKEGRIVGFDIDHASKVANLNELKAIRLPLQKARRTRLPTKKHEVPVEVVNALAKLPAGYKLKYDAGGKPHVVKERRRTYGRKK